MPRPIAWWPKPSAGAPRKTAAPDAREPDRFRALPDKAGVTLIQVLKRELSNARIVAAGLEMSPVRWRIGAKTYEPEKIRVFLESMWKRVHALERGRLLRAAPGSPEVITAQALETTELLRRMKRRLDQERSTLEMAARLFQLLHHYARTFFSIYFQTIAEPV